MKSCTEKQIEVLEKLYLSGKLDGSLVGDWRILSHDKAERLIVSSRNIAEGTFLPATPLLKEELRNCIQTGELVMENDLLRFMTLAVAEKMVWTVRSSVKNQDTDITFAQSCRIRILIAKGFLKYRPMSEIKSLSWKDAEKLIIEGEDNALNEY